ncbi:MAG: GNAT family N-acetyltransferase [Candidatus Dormiibacterota bacterium]
MSPLLRRGATLTRIVPTELPAVSALLDQDPVANVFLRSELRLGAQRQSWWALGANGSLRAVMLGGPLIVPWIPDPSDAAVMAGALTHQPPARLMIGPAPAIRALLGAVANRQRPREVRDPQPLMVLDRAPAVPPGVAVGRGRREDLDRLTLAAAAMHREEMGVDPMSLDPAGWRSRMATLVDRGWSFLWSEGGEILFKVELSAWTPEALQLQGVWTNPRLRRRGLAAAGLAAVCAELLHDVPLCSLYVNAYNEPALRLYARLGFRQVGEFATVMF